MGVGLVEAVSRTADKILGHETPDESWERFELRRALRNLREAVRPATSRAPAAPLWTHD